MTEYVVAFVGGAWDSEVVEAENPTDAAEAAIRDPEKSVDLLVVGGGDAFACRWDGQCMCVWPGHRVPEDE